MTSLAFPPHPRRASLTDLLVFGDAHNPHGLHGLLEQVLVLLTGDGDVPIGQEAVLVVWLQQEVSCEGWRQGSQGRAETRALSELQHQVWEAG